MHIKFLYTHKFVISERPITLHALLKETEIR